MKILRSLPYARELTQTRHAMFGTSSAIATLRARQAAADLSGKHCLVAGGTSGIGAGAALRLAQAGASVTILGRSETAGATVLASLRTAGPRGVHSFIPCDAFSLRAVRRCAAAAADASGGAPLDVLFLSQGMATLQGFTPTAEGLDEKLCLHVYSRAALTAEVLPRLRAAAAPRVVSILSAGVHTPYARWREDPDLAPANYSLPNAANMAGMMTDAWMDGMARMPGNERITFVHAAPGGVRSNWGSEFPTWLRWPLRALQTTMPLRTPADAAEAMLTHALDPELSSPAAGGGFRLVGPDAQPAPRMPVHDEAREVLWPRIQATIKRVLDSGHA